MKPLFIAIALSLILLSCNNEPEPTTTETEVPSLNITVIDATAWTPENTLPISAGATIVLSRNSNEYTQVTNDAGKADFDNLTRGSYGILVSKDNKYNMSAYNPSSGMGYRVDGIFNSQEEIDSYICVGDPDYKIQPNAMVGDLKLVDINADCLLSEYDKVNGVTIELETRADVNADGVITTEDKVDGAYQYLEEVNLVVYIGY